MQSKDAAGSHSILAKMLPFGEAQLGHDNPIVVTTKMALALNANALGQPAEAIRWWEQALAANERTLGNEHPNTTSVAWSLFLVRWSMGQFQECYRIFQDRFLWFCKKDSQSLDQNQRDIVSCIQKNTPWLPAE
jgi:hypothetical protein